MPVEKTPRTAAGERLYHELNQAHSDPFMEAAIEARRAEIQSGEVQTCGLFPVEPQTFIPQVVPGRDRREQVGGIIQGFGDQLYIDMVIEKLRNM